VPISEQEARLLLRDSRSYLL